MDRLEQLLSQCRTGNIDDIVAAVEYATTLQVDKLRAVRAALAVAKANNPEAMARAAAYKLFREE